MAYLRTFTFTLVVALAACGGDDGDRDPDDGTGSSNGSGTRIDGGVNGGDGGGNGGDGGGGVDPDKLVSDLTASEIAALCEATVDATDGGVTVCEDGTTIDPFTVEECVTTFTPDRFEGCSLTVSQARDCAGVFATDPCNGLGHPACIPVLECLAN